MLTKKDAVIGKRVKWQSLDKAIPPTYGRIVGYSKNQVVIKYDDGDDGEASIDNPASTVYPA